MWLSEDVRKLKCLYVDYTYEIAAATRFGLEGDVDALTNLKKLQYWIFYMESGCNETVPKNCTIESFLKKHYLRIFECSEQESCTEESDCNLTVTVEPPPVEEFCRRPINFEIL